jgi:two-component system, OmpR family, response regulator MprA
MTDHVLLVEDDDDILELLQTRLAMEGYSLSLARDGREALTQLETLTPSIMLLDLGLPRMNGYAVLETLEKQRPDRSFPILIITADPHAATTLAHKPVQILLKPFALRSLITLMHEMLTDRKKDVRSPHLLFS